MAALGKDYSTEMSKSDVEDGPEGVIHFNVQQASTAYWLDVHEAFSQPRYRNNEFIPTKQKLLKWRIRARMRTVCVGLIVALNIGVDPPDILKTDPCARMEAWIDINTSPSQKTLEHVGNQLQEQYSRMYARARFRQALDPTTEEVKKMCMQLRRAAKDERVLIHYNGHGVPMPTDCGEIWVFNKNFTQYIPLSLYDLQSFITGPSIFVWDCSNAGQIVKSYDSFARQRRHDYETQMKSRSANGHPPPTLIRDYIHLAACSAGEVLPMDPSLPADLFTACLTTPIEVAFQCVSLSYYKRQIVQTEGNILDRIPGKMTDRKTMRGELFWIFTAITDTIAWNVLPRDLFQKLFRQDLLVAALFRNFLLAERVLTSVNCIPVSYPSLPPTHQHPMWQHWDMSVDIAISRTRSGVHPSESNCHFPFFTNQLKAFEVWLELGSQERDPPEQLPIVLQVLLSQAHRLRALQLLQEFLDLGAWAVNLALSVGIFPYVLKLLQSPDMSIRNILCFIWTKILMVDKSCQHDISKEGGETYFIDILCDSSTSMKVRSMAAFCLSAIVSNNPVGQEACIRPGNDLIWKINRLLHQREILELDAHVRKWICLCAAKVWEETEDAKLHAMAERAHETVSALLFDPDPEVRAAASLALGSLVKRMNGHKSEDEDGHNTIGNSGTAGSSTGRNTQPTMAQEGGDGGGDGETDIPECHAYICESLVAAARDSSSLVRKEIAIAINVLLTRYRSDFKAAGLKRAARVFAFTAQNPANANGQGENESADVSVALKTTSQTDNLQEDGCVGDMGAEIQRMTVLDKNAHTSQTPTNLEYIDAHTEAEHGSATTSSNTTSRDSSLTSTSSQDTNGGIVWGDRSPYTSSPTNNSSVGGMGVQTVHLPARAFVIPFELAWDELVVMSNDPCPEIMLLAQTVLDDLRTPGFERARPARFSSGIPNSAHSQNSSVEDGFASLDRNNSHHNSVNADGTSWRGSHTPPVKRRTHARTNSLRKPLSHLFNSTGDIAKLIAMESTSSLGYGMRAISPLPFAQPGPANDGPLDTFSRSYDQMVPGGKPVMEPEETIKVESDYYARSCLYYKQPLLQLHRLEGNGIGNTLNSNIRSASGGYGPSEIRAHWIRTRNASVLKKAVALEHYNPGDSTKYSRVHLAEHMTIQSGDEGVGRAFNVVFHPFNSLVVVANGLDYISVHDWSTHTRKSSFHNGNSPNVCLSDIKIINEAHESSLLLTATDDGMVKVWRRYDEPGAMEIVTAWRGLADIPSLPAREAGVIIDWCTHSGLLVSAGDWPVVSLWDADYEKCTQLIETGSDSTCVSSLSHAPYHESLLVCGFGSGSVCLYDVRNSRAVMTLSDHKAWVLKSRIQSNSNGLLVSGSVDGVVKQWDLRKGQNVVAHASHPARSQMSALAIHNYAPLVATGSRHQEVTLTNQTDGQSLASVQYHEGFLGQRIGPVNCLTFHPHETVLAAGGTDAIVSVYRAG
eukprot:CFRG4490T1